MDMRKLSRTFLLLGITAYLLSYIVGWVFFATIGREAAFPDWLKIFSSCLENGGIVLVLLSAAARILATSSLSKQDGARRSTAEQKRNEIESDYRFFRNILLLGLIVWTFYISQIVGFALIISPNWWTVTLAILTTIALPLTIGALIFARARRNVDIKKSMAILKVPIYYGVIVAAVFYVIDGMRALLG
jgi:hypothetical protein